MSWTVTGRWKIIYLCNVECLYAGPEVAVVDSVNDESMPTSITTTKLAVGSLTIAVAITVGVATDHDTANETADTMHGFSSHSTSDSDTSGVGSCMDGLRKFA